MTIEEYRAIRAKLKPFNQSIVLDKKAFAQIRRLVIEPGNGCSYEILLTPCGEIGLGGTVAGHKYTYVSMICPSRKGHAFLDKGNILHPNYVSEKLGLKGEDAVAITEALTSLLCREKIPEG